LSADKIQKRMKNWIQVTFVRCGMEKVIFRQTLIAPPERAWLCHVEMGPDPTQAYFWPAVNKRPTRLRPGTFQPNPKRFFWPDRKKIQKFDIFSGKFPNSNLKTINGWSGPITSAMAQEIKEILSYVWQSLNFKIKKTRFIFISMIQVHVASYSML